MLCAVPSTGCPSTTISAPSMMLSCQRCMFMPKMRSMPNSTSSHRYSTVMVKQKVNRTMKKGESLTRRSSELLNSQITEKLNMAKMTPPVVCRILSYRKTWS